VQLPKYAILENERRFLVRPGVVEALPVAARRRIEDRYLDGARMRLRRIVDEGSGQIEFKLCKKYGSADPISEPIVNIYLTAEEHAAFAILPGVDIAKRRLSIEHAGRAFSLDLFEGPLQGLVICEAEAPSRDDVVALQFPPWVGPEVTADAFFSGANLASADPREVRQRVERLLERR
jgi:CYTH domain-containing protein